MISFSLPTFIKLCHLDDYQLLAEVDNKLNPKGKGHQFHRTLREAIYAHIDGADTNEIDSILNSPSREAEQKYNKAAFSNFLKRFGSNKTLEKVDKTAIYPMPIHDIEISVKPWFSTLENGQLHLHVVWATSKPDLAQRWANLGCLVLSETFKISQYGNAKFCIMDLTKPKRFSDKTITDRTRIPLENVAASIARCAKQV